MSEFSESYHIKNGSLEDSIQLIKMSSQSGYVGKFCDGWSTLIPESAICNDFVDYEIIKHNTGILLQFINPEDHGFLFRLFNGQQLVSECIFDYNDTKPIVDISKLNSLEFINLTGIGISDIELEKLLLPKEWEECFSLPGRLMELLGIAPKAYSWISYYYCQLLEKEDPKYGLIKI